MLIMNLLQIQSKSKEGSTCACL